MYARSTTFRGQPDAIDRAVAMIRDEVLPELETMGCVGMSALVDRTSGMLVATSAWETEEAERDSRERIAASRNRAAEMMGSDRPEVRHWEIAVLHRTRQVGDHGWARVVWVDVQPDLMDAHLGRVHDIVIPRLESFRGFCSMSFLVDRDSGRCVTASTFEDRRALQDSEDGAKRLRDTMVGHGGVAVQDVHEFEVAFAHLRVPATV